MSQAQLKVTLDGSVPLTFRNIQIGEVFFDGSGNAMLRLDRRGEGDNAVVLMCACSPAQKPYTIAVRDDLQVFPAKRAELHVER